MTELQELLYRVGHRPAKYGKAWVCAACPRGKTPALKVGDDVFYCHRCHKGGNIVSLKRELGIQEPRKTLSEARHEQEIRYAAEMKLMLIRDWQKRWRGYLIRRFQKAYDLELTLRDRGKAILESGLAVDQKTIDSAVTAALEKTYMEHWLNWFDGLSSRDLIDEYERFQRVLHEPIGQRLENEAGVAELLSGTRR